MASKRWYLTGFLSTDGGAGDAWKLLSETAQSASNAGNQWIVGTGSTFSSEFDSISTRAAATFVGNTVPDGTLDTTLHDALRTDSPLTGTFAAGNWTFQFAVVSDVSGGAADGQIVFRLIKANVDGSGATEITSAQQAASVCSNVSTTDVNGTITFNPGAITFANQYLFVQIAWKRTGAGGMSTTNIKLRQGVSATVGTTILSTDLSTVTHYTLTLDAAAVAVAMQAVGTLRGGALALDAPALALSAQALALNPGRTLALDAAAVTLGAQALGLLGTRTLTLDATAAYLTPYDVPLSAGAPSGLILTNPLSALQNTTATNDLSDDGYTWAAAKPLVVDQFGKLFIWAERHLGGSSHHRPVVSNDGGATWVDPTISGMFDSNGEGFLERAATAYDAINDLFHVLWCATDPGDGIIYRRYSVTRDGGNNITAVARVSGINLQLEVQQSGQSLFLGHPNIVWQPVGTQGQIVCVWSLQNETGTPTHRAQIRASMRVLSNTTADHTAANWKAPITDDADTVGNDALVPFSAVFSRAAAGGVPYAGMVLKTAGSHVNDLYIGFHDGDGSFGGTWQITRLAWDAGNSDWSNASVTVALDNVVVAGTDGGYASKRQLGSQLSEDLINDRVFFGFPVWLNNTWGDTQVFSYLNHVDVASSRTIVHASFGAHTYAPAIDVVTDPATGVCVVAYQKNDFFLYVQVYDGVTQVQAETLLFDDDAADIPLLNAGGRYPGTPDRLLCVFRGARDSPSPPYLGYFATMDWLAAAGVYPSLALAPAAVALDAQALALLRGRTAALETTAVALGAQALALSRGRTATLDPAAVVLDVQAVALLRGRALTLDATSVAVSVQAVALLRGRALTLDATTVTLGAQALALLRGGALGLDATTLAVSVQAVALLRGRALTLDLAAVAVSAQAVALNRGRALGLDAAAVALDVQAVALLRGRALALDPVAVALGVQAVALLRGPALGLDAAAVTLGAQAVNLNRGRALALDPAAVALSAQALELRRTATLGLDPAAVALAEQVLGLRRTATVLTLDPAAVALDVQALTLLRLAVSTIGLSATAVDLDVQAVDLRRTATLGLAGTSVAVSVQAVALLRGGALALAPAAVTLSGQALGLRRTATLALDATAVALSAQALALSRTATLALNPAAVALGLQALGLRRTATVGLDATTVTLSAQALGLARTKTVLALGPAAVTVEVQALGLVKLAASTITLAPAAVTVSVQALGLRRTATLGLDAAAVTVSVQAITLLRGRTLTLDPTTVALSAQALTLRRTATVFGLDATAVTLGAQAVGLTRIRHLALALDAAAVEVVPAPLGFAWGAQLTLAPVVVTVAVEPVALTWVAIRHLELELDAAGVAITVGTMTLRYSGRVVGTIELPGSFAPVLVMRGSDAHVVRMKGANDQVLGITGTTDPVVGLNGADDRVLVLTGATE